MHLYYLLIYALRLLCTALSYIDSEQYRVGMLPHPLLGTEVWRDSCRSHVVPKTKNCKTLAHATIRPAMFFFFYLAKILFESLTAMLAQNNDSLIKVTVKAFCHL